MNKIEKNVMSNASEGEGASVNRGGRPPRSAGPGVRSSGEAAMNEKIASRTLQVITHDGKNLGVITRDAALHLAQEAGLDLVVLSEKEGEAPIAKIMDYGKSLYAKKKQQTSSRKKQKTVQVKEIQISHKIGQHDFNTKIKRAREFLDEDKHVKIVLTFYGRAALMRDSRGSELFAAIDQSLGVGTDKIVHEKDVKSGTLWSRVYFKKS
jgi:translation initiation factor IF-3